MSAIDSVRRRSKQIDDITLDAVGLRIATALSMLGNLSPKERNCLDGGHYGGRSVRRADPRASSPTLQSNRLGYSETNRSCLHFGPVGPSQLVTAHAGGSETAIVGTCRSAASCRRLMKTAKGNKCALCTNWTNWLNVHVASGTAARRIIHHCRFYIRPSLHLYILFDLCQNRQ